jgi:hypothetical protein
MFNPLDQGIEWAISQIKNALSNEQVSAENEAA